jgi:hypothetical protein
VLFTHGVRPPRVRFKPTLAAALQSAHKEADKAARGKPAATIAA